MRSESIVSQPYNLDAMIRTDFCFACRRRKYGGAMAPVSRKQLDHLSSYSLLPLSLVCATCSPSLRFDLVMMTFGPELCDALISNSQRLSRNTPLLSFPHYLFSVSVTGPTTTVSHRGQTSMMKSHVKNEKNQRKQREQRGRSRRATQKARHQLARIPGIIFALLFCFGKKFFHVRTP
jgi:hypothetical protein